ncbi:MAG: hypothetical protein QOJ11_1756 [Frankiales bacterium]|nr:hypothetical protein [Frankiales bacterium]
MSGSPVVLYAEFTALPGEEQHVQDLLVLLGRNVRQEAGNVAFIAHRLAEHKGEFAVYEEYADEAAFAQHIASVHCADFNGALTSLAVGGGSTVTFLEKV